MSAEITLFNAETVFRRQILPSKDGPPTDRIKHF